mmetsp:Transcript_49223/g.107071  ORF Transcript_49223/g.107071 Transcript_49223/m.107071 type:complete len:200 (-) Transcript_49223:4-603(-)
MTCSSRRCWSLICMSAELGPDEKGKGMMAGPKKGLKIGGPNMGAPIIGPTPMLMFGPELVAALGAALACGGGRRGAAPLPMPPMRPPLRAASALSMGTSRIARAAKRASDTRAAFSAACPHETKLEVSRGAASPAAAMDEVFVGRRGSIGLGTKLTLERRKQAAIAVAMACARGNAMFLGSTMGHWKTFLNATARSTVA